MKLGIENTRFHKYLYIEDETKKIYFTLEEIKNNPHSFIQSMNYRLKKLKHPNDQSERLETELQAYRKAWKTLQGFIFNRQYCAGYEVQTRLILDILDKMQELEKKLEGNNGN